MATGEVAPIGAPGPARWSPPTVGPLGARDRPFPEQQLVALDEVIEQAETVTGLRFSAYLGDLGADTRATALGLLAGLGEDAPSAVLVAMSPDQRTVEVVTGSQAARRISDRAARLAVLSAVSSATDGDLSGALVNAIRTLADQAGSLPTRTSW